MTISLFDRETIDSLVWPQSDEAQQVKDFFVPLMKGGTEEFIENVKTRLFVVQMGGHLFPITVNEKEYDNAYVTSNYVFMEVLRQKLRSKGLLGAAMPFLKGLDLVLKGAKVNKVVIVNNWLFTMSLHPELNFEEVAQLTSFLSSKFHDHAIMWRSVNAYKGTELLSSLKQYKYRLVGVRNVFFLDPNKEHLLSSRARRHHRQDAKLLKAGSYEVIENEIFKEPDIPRLQELYNKIYVEKYKNVSPLFNEKFFNNLLTVKNIKIYALRKSGQIDGVSVLIKRGCEMAMALIGHDTSLPVGDGIYRILNHLAVEESKKSQLLFNLSTGADNFKEWRGGVAIPEYVAIFDGHLPLWRRLLFFAAAQAVKLIYKEN